ncbi:MAG: response regulator [Candidatus Latescibacteria bacterium]|nr:response regulator [Candidatus Latescibacterota bacterium]
MKRIAIVDDDPAVLAALRDTLAGEGYAVETAETPGEFLAQVTQRPPAVAIIDVYLGSDAVDGQALLGLVAQRSPNTQCLVVSGESDLPKALACLRAGAFDFLEKPVSLPRLLTAVRNGVAVFNSKYSAQERCRILGRSRAMGQVVERLRKLAALDETVLIEGESGTGKELVAENLHLLSPRFALPMTAVNCAALNPNLLEAELFGHKAGGFTGADSDRSGYFAAAQGSSLFIDEIGDFQLDLQSKVLRVLQGKTVRPVGSDEEVVLDARFIFATHRDLPQRIGEGLFREDLYFRISTFIIHLPPLRQRLEDIDDLAPHFLARFLRDNDLPAKEWDASGLERLKDYHYPGNIRELDKIVKNTAFFARGERLGAGDIEFSPVAESDIWMRTKGLSLGDSKAQFERELLERRLREAGGDIGRTAVSLDILRNNLYRKLRQYGIEWRDDGGCRSD